MGYRNVFGELEYKIGAFFVTHKKSGTYRIKKKEPWYVTNACFADNPWWDTPEFDSFIQACIWLKAHHTELL